MESSDIEKDIFFSPWTLKENGRDEITFAIFSVRDINTFPVRDKNLYFSIALKKKMVMPKGMMKQ